MRGLDANPRGGSCGDRRRPQETLPAESGWRSVNWGMWGSGFPESGADAVEACHHRLGIPAAAVKQRVPIYVWRRIPEEWELGFSVPQRIGSGSVFQSFAPMPGRAGRSSMPPSGVCAERVCPDRSSAQRSEVRRLRRRSTLGPDRGGARVALQVDSNDSEPKTVVRTCKCRWLRCSAFSGERGTCEVGPRTPPKALRSTRGVLIGSSEIKPIRNRRLV